MMQIKGPQHWRECLGTLLALGLLVSACADDGLVDNRLLPMPAQMDIVSGDAQQGEPGQMLPEPLVVRVLDETGVPIKGQIINFLVTGGGGSVFAGTSLTNAEGVAQERWTLGTDTTQAQSMEARAVDSESGERIVFATFAAQFSTASDTTALQVSNLAVASGKTYQVVPDGLKVGVVRFTDRDYTVASPVPTEVEGLTFIRTANDDKSASVGSNSFLSFDVNQDVTVYVAHDDRLTRPSWLEGWTDTGLELKDSEAVSTFSLFQKAFAAGTVTLGSNTASADGASSMYTVVVQGSGSGGTGGGETSDTEAPSVPTGLTATAVSSSRIDLSWTASTDNVGVSGYKVYREGTQIATTSTTSYSDTGLAASTTYSYTVAASDAAGNTSSQSAPVSATTQESSSGNVACTGEGVCAAAERPPALGPAGSSTIDPVFGSRVVRLTDESLCPGGANHAYSYWAALNSDRSLLLANCGGPTLFRVDLLAGSVQKLGNAFHSVQLYWEGFIWSRSDPTKGYGALASTSQARLIEYDVSSHSHTVVKDFQTDAGFTSVFGSSVYLWQLSASLDQTRFAATVRQSGTYKELGLVVYDRSTGKVWNYTVPSGEALDEGQIDRSGRYLSAKLLGRKWQVWDLSQAAPSAVITGGPGHSDNGSGAVFQGHGKGMMRYPLDPPGVASMVYSAPLVDGKVNGYADAHTSAVANNGFIYWSPFVEGDPGTGGALVTSWQHDSGEVWKLNYNQEISARPNKRLPEVVRMGRHQLKRVEITTLNRGEWYFDTGTGILYVRNPDGSDPSGGQMMAFDWRPLIGEIARVREDGTGIERLAHHYSYVDSYGSMPRAAASYDGSVVVFNSNWGGRDRVDVFAVVLP